MLSSTHMTHAQHVSVLLHESVDGLNLHDDSVFIDGTFGAGGHSCYATEKHKELTVVVIDQDGDAIERGKKMFAHTDATMIFANTNFSQLDVVLQENEIDHVDGILLDLGTSVDQIKTSGRGFTFEKDEPLLMTLSTQKDVLTAKDILNIWSAETIETVLRNYGNERFARRIAEKITESRQIKQIETTSQLVEIIKEATPQFYHVKKIHPATKTFQALRIAVNDEITMLQTALQKGIEALSSGGRMAVIAFHSLEDREVKKHFRNAEDNGKGKRITKKPITASREEIESNPRSRSAKLRIFEKI